jgi:colicin import membrane protein
VNVKVDKTLVASVALHVLVIGWGLVSFSSKAFESIPEESLPVDVISSDQLAKVTAGMKTGKKDNPKPLAEKVAEAKPADDAVGKISEKPPVVTDTSPPPVPKVEDKPVEKKPDPPKPIAEAKPKEEPKPIEKKPDPPKVDPIAEAIKKDEKKPLPKPQAQAAAPQPPKPKTERAFDQTKIAALLDKRDPTRQAVTGAELNSNAALGLAHGKAADNSATWGSMFKEQVERCWKKPYGGIESQNPVRWKARRFRKERPARPIYASIRRARCARSSSASRITCPRPFSTNGNISRRYSPSERPESGHRPAAENIKRSA